VDGSRGKRVLHLQKRLYNTRIKLLAGGTHDLRAGHACYLIQKSSLATPEARAFLAKCLQTGSPSLQGRALRAYAKLHDTEIEQWLRPLSEQIVSGTVDRNGKNAGGLCERSSPK